MDSSEKEIVIPQEIAPIEVLPPSDTSFSDAQRKAAEMAAHLKQLAQAEKANARLDDFHTAESKGRFGGFPGLGDCNYGARPDLVLAKRELQAAAVEAIAAMSNVLDVLTENANAYATDPWRKERKEAHLKGIQNAIAALTKALG